jgi:hypothetical protein
LNVCLLQEAAEDNLAVRMAVNMVQEEAVDRL